jgi:hypothetical protein
MVYNLFYKVPKYIALQIFQFIRVKVPGAWRAIVNYVTNLGADDCRLIGYGYIILVILLLPEKLHKNLLSPNYIVPDEAINPTKLNKPIMINDAFDKTF